ncbi:MAG: hypothetical protein LBS19_02215 [Clostridiales bacterium]|jgi:hypothetical protein|nr:hypothetical protein [Clostridiales bacterium]
MKAIKIYLDNCCHNRPFDSQTNMKIRFETEAKLYIQNCILEGEYNLCWSFVLDYENGNNPFEDKRNIISSWKKIAKDFCYPNEAIRSRGKELMNLGIKELDALHIACAMEKQCDYFITVDRGLLNKNVDGLKIINPIDFIRKVGDQL